MTSLPLHVQLDIETSVRRAQHGETKAIDEMSKLLAKWPFLAASTSLGLEHPLGRLVLEMPEGRAIKWERDW